MILPLGIGGVDVSPFSWTRLVRMSAVLEEESAPCSYAAQFRARLSIKFALAAVFAEVAAAFELPESTVFRWVRQDRIDRGELASTPTAESAQLRQPSAGSPSWSQSWPPSSGPASCSTRGGWCAQKTSSGSW